MGRRRSGVLAVTSVVAGAGRRYRPGRPPGHAGGDGPRPTTARPRWPPLPGSGALVYDGLSLGRKGSACAGRLRGQEPHRRFPRLLPRARPGPARHRRPPRAAATVKSAVDLRTGADEAPAARRAARPAAPLGSVGCVGDGTAGPRGPGHIYAVPADRTDRSATVIPTIRSDLRPPGRLAVRHVGGRDRRPGPTSPS